MPTNVQITTTSAPAILYMPDGSAEEIPPGTQHFVQLPNSESFCTISEAPAEEERLGFIERMKDYWQALWTKIRAEIAEETGGAEATPAKK
jgi:hypothetical protein